MSYTKYVNFESQIWQEMIVELAWRGLGQTNRQARSWQDAYTIHKVYFFFLSFPGISICAQAGIMKERQMVCDKISV